MTMTETEVPEWTLGDRIHKARRHAGLEQADVAEACGVSRPLVSQWENDRAEPRANQLARVSELTGVPADWLLGFRTGSFTCGDDEHDMIVVSAASFN